MELAVCLSAGLRDWIDFGVIVSAFACKCGGSVTDAPLDWYPVFERHGRLVPGEVSPHMATMALALTRCITDKPVTSWLSSRLVLL